VDVEWRWRKKFRIFGTLVKNIAIQDMKYHAIKEIKVFPLFFFGSTPLTPLKLHYYFSKLRPILLIKISNYKSVM
jgi:hypothetical protein